MANPQPDSFTRLSNELLEAIMKSDFSKRQYNILFLIWRCSYGFDQKVAKLKKCDFQAVGIYPTDIAEELNYLKETRVIFWDEANDLIAFNKDYDRWRISLSKTAVNGKVNFKKILKRQFEDFEANLDGNTDENISKILSLSSKKVSKTLSEEHQKVSKTLNNTGDNVSETLSNEDKQVSKILTQDDNEVSKTLTSNDEKVSKTLTSQSSEPSDGADHRGSKETSTKETNNKEINTLRNVKGNRLHNRDTEEDDDFHPAYKKILDYAKQKIVVNFLSREYLISEDLQKHSPEVLRKAIDLAVMRQKSQGKYTRGDPKNGVDIGSWKYVQCFIEEAKEVLKGGSDNERNSRDDSENNGEESKDEGARLQKKAFELMGFEEA